MPTPYDSKIWVKTDFNVGPDGLTVTGNVGKLKASKFILDTGATASILHTKTLKDFNKKTFTSNLVLGDLQIKDHLFQMADFQEPPVDGILGYNFFAQTVVYLDLLNQELYLSS